MLYCKKKIEINSNNPSYNYYILSNNHVLTENGNYPIGSLVVQPNENAIVNSQLPNLVGVLDDFIKIETFKWILKSANVVDCCIAKVINNSLVSNKLLGLSKIISASKIIGVTKAKLGMSALKTAATTNIQKGKVITLYATTLFTDIFDSGKNAIFINQIHLAMKSDAGDSGSPILTIDGKLIGMTMGTNKIFKYVIANDINKVFRYLNVEPYLGESLVY